MSDIGTRRERQVRDWFRERDFIAFRAPASLGVADVVALKSRCQPRFCEVKATSRGPWHGFPPADRKRLYIAAAWAGALPLLAHWPKNGKLRFYGPKEWPNQELVREWEISVDRT